MASGLTNRHEGVAAGDDPGSGELRSVRRSPTIDDEPQLLRQYGHVAAALFIAAALVAIPSSLLQTPAQPAGIYVFTTLALASGLVCLVLPWERIPIRWFHLVAAAATVEIAVAVAVDDRTFAWYYVFVAVFAAYVFPTRIETAVQVALASIGFLAPAIYDPDTAGETIRAAIVAIPSFALAALVVTYLHERLDAKQRLYRRFAEETLALAIRIGGREALPPFFEGAEEAEEPAGAAARSEHPVYELLRNRTGRARAQLTAPRWALVVPLALSLPFTAAALAAAGVSLPDVARAPFEAVGVQLPNQASPASGTGRESILQRPGPERAGAGHAAAIHAVAGGKAQGKGARDDGAGKGSGARGDGDHQLASGGGLGGEQTVPTSSPSATTPVDQTTSEQTETDQTTSTTSTDGDGSSSTEDGDTGDQPAGGGPPPWAGPKGSRSPSAEPPGQANQANGQG